MEVCKTYETTFWGSKYTITPALIDQKLGDGKQIIAFQPLSTRPNYYFLFVDSTWDIDNTSWNKDRLFDHYDEICLAIEEEYGSHDNDEDGEEPRDFPTLNSDCGAQWWKIEDINEYLVNPNELK